ncbi:MAG: DNA alkylation repair protein, partial [Acidimicrobiia bacterium]
SVVVITWSATDSVGVIDPCPEAIIFGPARSDAGTPPAANRPRFLITSPGGKAPRAHHIADALALYLPSDRREALRILGASLGPPLGEVESAGMESFLYLPDVFFVAEHGLDHFEEAMSFQYQVTQRFTAEGSIRAFLDRYPDKALDRLREWAGDSNMHVRRLVSEGTRPRLPWASRLSRFQKDPTPVLELLELLKDDPTDYVRRSVANNLNDISKDHPDLVVETGRRWLSDPDRRRLVEHGLRTLVKQGHPGALAALGFGTGAPVVVESVAVESRRVAIGGRVTIEAIVSNPTSSAHRLVVDIRVHFVKANGATSPKVFKGAVLELAAGATARVRKSISLAIHTTRTPRRGEHQVEILINGLIHPGGSFEVVNGGSE